ncbi:Iterative polyketide synthase CazM [Trichoderma lentiforme]|uniref:Iterative polyketide synthase CazM n=1 Tax=Trichoderma lentiforme TaxID=1567552 RepID=A0A9P4XCW8_9HYPO|nr:Iterative polyketide synthase CazM [Trichoderma lentiforme]
MGSVVETQETRSLINIIDDDAAKEPNRPFIFIPRSNQPQDGWEPVTYGQMANAVNHVAHTIKEMAANDIQEDNFPTIAYIGPNDVRYIIIMLACIKAKCKAFFTSPRNTIEGQLSLLAATDCHYFLYGEGYQPVIKKILAQRQMHASQVPSAKDWITAKADYFPYQHTAYESRWHPWIAMHTSGSTGMPKPIVINQANIQLCGALRHFRDERNNPSLYEGWASRASRLFNPMPLFHGVGIAASLMFTVYYGLPCALGIPERPLSEDLVKECLANSGVDAALLPPSVIDGMSQTEDGLKAITNLNFISYSGGNLSGAVGDKLVANGAFIINMLGSSEAFPMALQFQSDPNLWQYFIFNADVMGAKFTPTMWDGIYGLTIQRKDPLDPGLQPTFYNFPDKQEFVTGDLFQAHETLPDHYKYYGRNDNVIVFSNGEKLNPVTIEDIVVSHPAIKNVLVVGQERFQPAMILEPKGMLKDDAEAEALIDDVWPLIEEANQHTVAHGQIVRELVAVSDPKMPFFIAGKGTVQRVQTVNLYKEYIDGIYERAEATLSNVTLDIASREGLASSIHELLRDKLGIEQLERDADFFGIGIDSLQVMTISKLLRGGLKRSGVEFDESIIATRVIYSNPSVNRLAEFLFRSISPSDEQEISESYHAQQIKDMQDMVAKYTQDLPERNVSQTNPNDTDQTVILTGSTGSLGSYILDQLISSSHVSKVYALNRGGDGGFSRQCVVSASRSLSLDFSKVEFLGVDVSKPKFGLDAAKYAELLSSTDRIIHNAWPVNFNMSIASFEPYIRGVRHFVDFAGAASKKVALVFVSSIGTAINWTASEPVPERRLEDPTLADLGYGISKLASGWILDAAAEKSGLAAASVRVGQIAGPKEGNGIWNPQEFVPSLIASSLYLGVLPQRLGIYQNVDWVATEDVAGILIDLAGISKPVPISEISGYFHAQNPTKVQWPEMIEVLRDFYGDRIKEVVSLDKWVSLLEASAAEGGNVDKNPGVKLIDTYRGLSEVDKSGVPPLSFAMTRTASKSKTAAALQPITPELMRKWCEGWNF